MQAISFLSLQSDVSFADSQSNSLFNRADNQFLSMLETNLSERNTSNPGNNERPEKTVQSSSESTSNTNTNKYAKDNKVETKNQFDYTTESLNKNNTEIKTTKKVKTDEADTTNKLKIATDRKQEKEETKVIAMVQDLLVKLQDILAKLQLPSENKTTDKKNLVHSLSEIIQKLEKITIKDDQVFSKTELKAFKDLIKNIQDLIATIKTTLVENKTVDISFESNQSKERIDGADSSKQKTTEQIEANNINDSNKKTSPMMDHSSNISKKAETKPSTETSVPIKKGNNAADQIQIPHASQKTDSNEIKKIATPILNQINEILSTLEGTAKATSKPISGKQSIFSFEEHDSRTFKMMSNLNRVIEKTDIAEKTELIVPKAKAEKLELNLKSVLSKSENETSTELVLKSDKSSLSLKSEFLSSFFKPESPTEGVPQEIKVNATQMERIEQIEKQVQIVKQVRSFISLQKLNAETEVTLRLHPKSLGEIKINITKQEQTDSHNSLIIAKFQVDSETVKSILESNMNELKDMLSDNSQLSLSEFSVEVNDHNKENFNDFFKQGSHDEEFSLNLDDSMEIPKEMLEDQYAGMLNSIA